MRRIRADRKVPVGNAKTLLDTGPDTLRGPAIKPVIKPPAHGQTS